MIIEVVDSLPEDVLRRQGRETSPFIAHVRALVLQNIGTGKYVKVALSDVSKSFAVNAGVRLALEKRGIRVRSRKDSEFIYIWGEKIPEKAQP